jgi:hypothetical protein
MRRFNTASLCVPEQNYKDARRQDRKEADGAFKYNVVKDGCFDMELCPRCFAQHYRQVFNRDDAEFRERRGWLVFLNASDKRGRFLLGSN